MKVIGFDKRQGDIRLTVESPEDCWVLAHIIDEGDQVKARTIRKIKKGAEGDRKQAVIKRNVTLTIEVEKVEFTQSSLRVLGVIRDGPDDIPLGVHHTIIIEDGMKIDLHKKEGFMRHHLVRIEQAKLPPPDQILLIVHDREQAIIVCIAKEAKILARIKGIVQKKGQDQQIEDFYKNLAKHISDYKERLKAKTVIVASPAFFKEDLMKVVPQDLKKSIILATCSSVTRNGVDEVLKRDEVKAALSKDRVSKHLKLVFEVTARIAQDGKIAYGIDQVERAAQSGAVETLIVTEKRIKDDRENKTFKRLDSLMLLAEQSRAVLVLMDSTTEPARKVDGLGGIVALLRYKVE